jgi:hypothetical protein
MKNAIFWDKTLASCSAYASALKMKVICSSETSNDFQWTTWYYISYIYLHNHCCENLKSHKFKSGHQDHSSGFRMTKVYRLLPPDPFILFPVNDIIFFLKCEKGEASVDILSHTMPVLSSVDLRGLSHWLWLDTWRMWQSKRIHELSQ